MNKKIVKMAMVLSLGLALELEGAPALNVTDLQCEHMSEPLGIDITRPRLSWKLTEEQVTRGQRQTGYHIVVASRRALLDKGTGDLWDSGKVTSSQSVLVPYAGKPLVSNQDCYWKVRVWDKDGKPSAWSEPGRFSVGLLDADDWKGRWITRPAMTRHQDDGTRQWVWLNRGDPQVGAPAGACYFRRHFTLPEGRELKSADFELSADNAFELWVNGVRAGAGDNWQKATSINIKPMLKPGDNMLAVKAVNTVPGPAGFIGSLRMVDGDGKTHTIVTDAEWQAAERVSDGWQTGQPGDAKWEGVKVLGPKAMAPWGGGGRGDGADLNDHVWYRKTFRLNTGVESAFLHVASIGYHELHVNGVKVDDRVLAPALTKLDKRVLYVTYDVTGLLKAGDNVIAIWCGPGWSREVRFAMPACLRVQLEGTAANGTPISVASDDSWRCMTAPSANTGRTRPQYKDHGGERMDGQQAFKHQDWNTAGYDDSQWSQVEPVSAEVTLSAHMLDPSRIIETIPATRIVRRGDAYRVELSRNFTGFLRLRLRGQSAGDRVTLKVADDPKTEQDFGQFHEYICAGNDGETFQNRFNYTAGRYITIAGLKQEPRLEDIAGLAVSTDIKRTGHFTCSNDLFNRIYETDLWTFLANTTEGFTADCPHRERFGYGEVHFASAWGIGLPNYHSTAFYRKGVRDWADVQEADGRIGYIAPQVSGTAGGPMWCSAGLNVAMAAYRISGDEQILAETYDSSRRWLEFLQRNVRDGLLRNYAGKDGGKFLGDWAAPGGRKEWGTSREAEYFNNCVYAMNLMNMSHIARLLGKQQDEAEYESQLRALRAAIHAAYFDDKKGTYASDTQVQLAFALSTGVVPDDQRARIESRLAQRFTEQGYFDMGSSGLPVLMKYLTEESGRADLAYPPLTRTTQPSYGYFLARGETTWPEYWSVDVPRRIHTCFTGVSSWFVKSLAGIQPDPAAPGFRNIIIRPEIVGDVLWVNAHQESPYGRIVSNWKRDGDRVEMTVSIPANATATVHVPAEKAADITVNGQSLDAVELVRFVKLENGRAVLRTASGNYTFTGSCRGIQRSNSLEKKEE